MEKNSKGEWIASKKYLETQNAFGYKVYYKKDGKTAFLARYLSSKWWNPFDWLKVNIES